jgi:nucleoid-associated protein YgaU
MKNLNKLTLIPFARKQDARKQDTFVRLPAIPLQFNPETYSISKSVHWDLPKDAAGSSIKSERGLNAPRITFGGGDSRQLSLELFFDTSIPGKQIGTTKIEDVRKQTNKIVTLTRIEAGEAHPRVCELIWGDAPAGSDFPFKGVITSLTQKFTQFSRDGKPVRAYLSVTFREFLDPQLDKRRTDRPSLTTRVLQGGDNLSNMARDLYHDPKRWRLIAETNGIDNPLKIPVGQSITIPKINL